ncbi:hypothetical protein CBR_g29377 [Chara braunii]|uniref:Reverse transcriptase domain-containing protein n=1 Tax=Chara braunii TaxID=69332 RepID=A0A388JWM5_CHABU|nr:hypothetical protein CBR_g29377 [Chara braunii]|eukprot:GBG62178.1 hypothetical protein CBR_g29377 [Chara braunii]
MTFQAAMTNKFRAMLDRFVLVYLDDILVYSRTLEEHLEHLRRVLETLLCTKYKANRDKCEFVRQELKYLGHFVTPQGSSPLSDKIQAIQDWSEQRNVTDVCSFLGLAGYYQRFIKGYSKIVAHLSKLQCEDRPSDFGTDVREPFLALKAALLSTEALRIYDPLLPTHVTTDPSGYGIGVVLEQHDGVDWHPFEYFSKKVSVVHSINDARKKELLTFVHALKRWWHFLLGRRQFRWVTDNNLLVFYKTRATVNTIARWMDFIDQFDFFPDHIPGRSNRFVDALSRRPDHYTAVYSTFEIKNDLRDGFIRGYQADPEFCDKYANCSSPNPAPSHYRIQELFLFITLRILGSLHIVPLGMRHLVRFMKEDDAMMQMPSGRLKHARRSVRNAWVSKKMKAAGSIRSAEDCWKKWCDLMSKMKDILHKCNASGKPSYWEMSVEDRKREGIPMPFEEPLWEEMEWAHRKPSAACDNTMASSNLQGAESGVSGKETPGGHDS